MSADIVESLSTKLFREKWASTRQSCELLASTLHQYACEIQGKNKVMKNSSGTPWRSIEGCMDVMYLKPVGSVCTEF